MFDGKKYWIIGASEGLGRALAREMSNSGASVILSARNEERLIELAKELPNASVCAIDVTDEASIKSAAEQIGQFDGVVYCAGFYEPVKATDWNSAAAVTMADVNFTGALRVLGQAVPKLLEQDQGHIILIGSLAGFRGLPGAIGYGASKAALMHLAENLRADLKHTKISVQCMNPGFIKTRLTEKNDFKMPSIMTPETAARHVANAIKNGRFSTSFPVPFAWLFRIGRFLPLSVFQRLF